MVTICQYQVSNRQQIRNNNVEHIAVDISTLKKHPFATTRQHPHCANWYTVRFVYHAFVRHASNNTARFVNCVRLLAIICQDVSKHFAKV